MKSPTVFVFAPQGAGKTINAEALRVMFGCTSVVDDWSQGSFITDGALVLSSLHPFDLIEHGRNTRGNPVEIKAAAGVAGLSALVEAVKLVGWFTDSQLSWKGKNLTRDDAEHLAKKHVLALLSDADVLRCADLIDKAAAGSSAL